MIIYNLTIYNLRFIFDCNDAIKREQNEACFSYAERPQRYGEFRNQCLNDLQINQPFLRILSSFSGKCCNFGEKISSKIGCISEKLK